VRSVDETLNVLQDELHSVESQLSEPDVASDLARLRDLSRRHKELLEINNAWIELKAAQSDFSTAKEMFNETSGDDRELWREEMNNAEEKIPELEVNLETLLLPHDPNEGRNVILEIRGAEGARRPTSSPATSPRCTGATPHCGAGSSTSSKSASPNRAASMRPSI